MQTLKYMENCLNKLTEHYGFNLHEFEKNSSTEKNPTNKKDAVASDIDAEIDVNRKNKKRQKTLIIAQTNQKQSNTFLYVFCTS